MNKNLFKKSLPGFTLIEVSIVLIIIGLIAAAVFKGQDLIESARLQIVASDFNRYHLATMMYRDQFGAWPGNDPRAKMHFGSQVSNGDGKGLIKGAEADLFWVHLSKAWLVRDEQPPASKIGGFFSVIANPKSNLIGNWLVLSSTPGQLTSLLTPQQTMHLLKKMGEGDIGSGDIQVSDGDDSGSNKCIISGHFNLENKQPSCVILRRL